MTSRIARLFVLGLLAFASAQAFAQSPPPARTMPLSFGPLTVPPVIGKKSSASAPLPSRPTARNSCSMRSTVSCTRRS